MRIQPQVDRLYDWKTQKDAPIRDTLDAQERHVTVEFEQRLSKVKAELMEQVRPCCTFIWFVLRCHGSRSRICFWIERLSKVKVELMQQVRWSGGLAAAQCITSRCRTAWLESKLAARPAFRSVCESNKRSLTLDWLLCRG